MKIGKKLGAALAVTTAVSALAIADGGDTVWNFVQTELTKIVGAEPLPAHPLERLEKDETAQFWKIAQVMFKINMSVYLKDKAANPSTAIDLRDAHAKAHGCVVGGLEIAENIPDWARVGILSKPGHVYPAIARFSNGTQIPGASDVTADTRGMAVKLVDPENLQTNLLGTGKTQDIMMVNADRFLTGSIKDYLAANLSILKNGDVKAFIVSRAIREAIGEQTNDEVIQALLPLIKDLVGAGALEKPLIIGRMAGILNVVDLAKLLSKLSELKEGKAPLEAVIAKDLIRQINSSLEETYFSVSSYRLKSGVSDDINADTAVKYIMKPINCDGSELVSTPTLKDQDFLRKDLAARVGKQENCFAFMIQPLPNVDLEAKRTLVEDSRQRYGTDPIRVGTLRIAQQDFSSDAKTRYCENLSFNPWQAQPEHQPLGSMNRARRFAVTASSLRRHFINGVERAEPTSLEEYKSLK